MEMQAPYYIVRLTAIHKEFTKVTEFKEKDRDVARQEFVREWESRVCAGFTAIIEFLKVEYEQNNHKGLVLLERFESNGFDENKNHVMRYKCY